MDNEGVPKHVTGRMEGLRKWGKTTQKWSDDFEENMKVMGIRNCYRVPGDKAECRGGLYWNRRSTPVCSAGGGVRGETQG